MSPSRISPREAKRRQEWQEAEDRRNTAQAAQSSSAVFERDLSAANLRIANLEVQLEKERKRHIDAENREGASASAVLTAVPGTDPTDDIEAIIDQLNEDYSIVSYNVDSEYQIPGPVRKELAQQLQVTCKHRIDEAKRLVDELKRRLQGSHTMEESEVKSAVRSAVLTITQQLQALNRREWDIKRRTARQCQGSDETAVPTFTWETNKLPLTESLGFDELLNEFREAAEVPIRYVEVANSLREQLRVATSSQWKEEKDAQDARHAASQAQAHLSLIQHKGQREVDKDYADLRLQLEQCHNRGEEMKLEILKLRTLLENAPKPVDAPGSSRDASNPIARQEARALLRLIEVFIGSSASYQQIIRTLEGGEIPCEEAKKRLQDQIDNLIDQDHRHQRLQESTVKMACLETENIRLRNSPGNGAPSSPMLAQKEIENNKLREQTKKLQTLLDALRRENEEQTRMASLTTNDQIKELRKQLAKATKAKKAIKDEGQACQKELVRLRNDVAALEVEATQIIEHIRSIPRLAVSTTEFKTMQDAVDYLQGQWQNEKNALDVYWSKVTPDYLAKKQEVQDVKERARGQKKRGDRLQKELYRVQSLLDDMTKQFQDCREEHKNDDKYIFENFSAQEASLKNQLAIAREASAEDNRVLKEYGNELAAAQKALRDCQNGLGGEDSQARIETLQAEIDALKTEREKLRRHIEAGGDEMEELAASNEDLQRRLKTAEEELNETKKALEDCEKRQHPGDSPGRRQAIRDLMTQRDDLQRRLDESEKLSQDTRDALNEALATGSGGESPDSAFLQQQIADLTAQVTDLKTQKDKSGGTLDTLQEQWDEAETKYEAQIKDLQDERDSLQKAVDHLQKRIGNAAGKESDDMFDWKASYESLQEYMKDMGERYAEAREELEVQKGMITTLEQELQDKREETDAYLEGGLQDLQEEYDSLQQFADDLQRERDVAAEELDRTKKALEECLARHGGDEDGGDAEGNIPPPAMNELPEEPTPDPETPAADTVSEDTPDFTPGGTKKRPKPGARLRRETRANKRRAAEWYKKSDPHHQWDVHEPRSPDEEDLEP